MLGLAGLDAWKLIGFGRCYLYLRVIDICAGEGYLGIAWMAFYRSSDRIAWKIPSIIQALVHGYGGSTALIVSLIVRDRSWVC